MFEEADSLGVSQGQGRGFAQVFDSTYNPVFKEETARLIEKDKAGKKEIDRQLESIDGGVWFRDEKLVKDQLGELYQYVQDNNKNILRGNTKEALEYKKKIIDIKAVVTQSKLAEQQAAKYLFALEDGGDKWDEDESKKSIQAFVDAPGDMDFSKLQLVPSFSMSGYEKKFMQPQVSKLINTITQSSKKDEFGNYNYDQVEKTSRQAMDNWANRMWSEGNAKMKSSYGSLDKFKEAVYDYGDSEMKKTVKTPYIDPNKKQQDKLDFTITKKRQGDMSIPYGEEGSENKIFKKGKFIALNEVAGNFKETIPATSVDLKNRKAIPISVFGIWQGTNGDIIDDVYDGDFWAKGNQGSFTFTPKLVRTLPVFRPQLDSKGNPIDTKNFRKNSNGEIEILADTKDNKKRWIPVDNISLDENDVKSGKFRGINLSDNNVKWEQFVIGNYGKKLGNNQENFDVAMPFDEYKGFVVANGNASQELTNFMEVINNKDSSVLTPHSYSKGKQMYFGNEAQPQQTKKAPDSTSKKRVYTKDEQDEYNEYKSSLKKGVTPISIDKYFE